ncbi:MAG: hypothetical protein CSA81_14140 [Acidobacteria bacterium]|nr:MAG: hypothetical protein CSA81_14140 [Acidobacteriota bacterium]
MKKVICIGSAAKDIFLSVTDSRIIDNSQDLTAQKLMAFELGAKVYADSCQEKIGGSAVNVAAGLTKAEVRAFIFARVGRGPAGDWIAKQIGKLKIKKNYLQQRGKTGSSIAVVVSDQKIHDRVIFRAGDSIEEFDLEKALARFREKVNWIYVASQKNGWQEKMKKVIDFAKQKKAKLAITPSSWQISKDANDFASILDKIEVLFLNRDEAIELVQNIQGEVEDKPKYLMEQLLKFGPQVVAITDGPKGAYVSGGKEIFFLPATAKVAKEALGAGDAFCSGFLANYIETANIKQSLAWGIVNAGGVVEKVGGTEGILKRKEIKYRAEELVEKAKEI